MRLFLLPINSRNIFIYAQRINKQIITEQTRVEKLSTRANNIWQRWESRNSGWQKRVTIWGNNLFARIPYQEWGLKSIPPLSARRNKDEIEGSEKVEVLFPSKALRAEEIPDVLRKLTTKQLGFHTQRMFWSLAGMPLTIPFALIPVVPNLPFLYLVFRAYSHWKARAGAHHVTYLLDNKLIKYSQSALLQKIYDVKELPVELVKSVKESIANKEDMETQAEAFARAVEAEIAPAGIDQSTNSQTLLITEGTGSLVSLCFGVPQVDVEIGRAINQVKKQVADEEKQASAQNQIDDKEKKQ